MSDPIKATSTKASESAFHIRKQSFHDFLAVAKDRQLRLFTEAHKTERRI